MVFDHHIADLIINNMKYKVSITYTGSFYHSKIDNPPSQNWAEVGIGNTEEDSINALILKIQNKEAA